MISKRTLARLLVTALVLPIAICVVWTIAQLLLALGDLHWAGILTRVALGGSILWVVDLIGLLIALAVQALVPDDESSDASE